MISPSILSGWSQKQDGPSNRIPCQIFSLSGNGCERTKLSYLPDNDEVIINSPDESKSYITDLDKDGTPSFDFSKYMPVSARGMALYGYAAIQNQHRIPIRGDAMNIDSDSGSTSVITDPGSCNHHKQINGT